MSRALMSDRNWPAYMLFLCLVKVYHPTLETSGILKLSVGTYFLKAHTHLKEEYFFKNIPAMEKKFKYRAESISAQRSGMLTQFLLEKVSEECSPISRKIGAVVLSGTSENSGCGTKERFVEKY